MQKTPHRQNHALTRRQFLATTAAGATAFVLGSATAQDQPFSLNYNCASCLYGRLPLAEILPEVHKIGADTIDIWPAVHANQREQVEAMGLEKFQSLLDEHNVRLGMITRYDLGPFKVQDEFKVLQQLGGKMIVTGTGTPRRQDGLKEAVQAFVEKLKPHVAAAEEAGAILAIENHANALFHEPDSLRYFAEFADSEHVGIAFAPYHLPQDPELIAQLIKDIGPKLVHFYAWEHGHGSHEKMPKVLEMKQLPGYGPLDFAPIIDALKAINYTGWTSIFMHPVPRGIPILPTATEVTNAINRSRAYLDSLAAS